MIDDADDARVCRNLDRIKREACLLAADKEHRFTDASAHRVDSDERPAGVRSIRRKRLQHQQLHPCQVVVLARDDEVADHFRQLHQSPAATSTVSTMPTIAASTGQSFIPDAMRAELPLTMRTVSPTPASTVSTATR